MIEISNNLTEIEFNDLLSQHHMIYLEIIQKNGACYYLNLHRMTNTNAFRYAWFCFHDKLCGTSDDGGFNRPYQAYIFARGWMHYKSIKFFMSKDQKDFFKWISGRALWN